MHLNARVRVCAPVLSVSQKPHHMRAEGNFPPCDPLLKNLLLIFNTSCESYIIIVTIQREVHFHMCVEASGRTLLAVRVGANCNTLYILRIWSNYHMALALFTLAMSV
jgi:hypothetical protein